MWWWGMDANNEMKEQDRQLAERVLQVLESGE